MLVKICSKCRETKLLGDFHKANNTKDGLYSSCKLCKKLYHRSNKDKANARSKRWKDGNKTKIKEYNKDYKKNYLGSFVSFRTYQPQLEPYGVVCREHNHNILETKCWYCGKWFIPTNQQIQQKAASIKGYGFGECNLYCSEGCKYSCSTYGQHLYPKDHKPATSREVQPQLRKLVLERDNWTCQKCGSTDELHCHHIDPVINNPIESADVDNCITYCVECHKEAHQQDGCKELIKCI